MRQSARGPVRPCVINRSVSFSSVIVIVKKAGHFYVHSRCGRKGTIYEPVWADLEDFQTIQISGLMWEDHMPDFVLKALNQCLPSKEQEKSVLSASDPPCPNTLEIPPTGIVQPNHFLIRNNRTGSGSLEEGNVVFFLFLTNFPTGHQF